MNEELDQEDLSLSENKVDTNSTENKFFKDILLDAKSIKYFISSLVFLFLSIFLLIFVYYINSSEMRPFVNLPMERLIPVLDFLDREEIPYSLKKGVLNLEAEDIDRVKLMLIRENIDVSNERKQDFLTKDSGFGVSQQLESARLKYEQEENIAATIEELADIKKAKVILALPESNIFARKKEKPTATVVLKVNKSYELPQEEVDAIVDIVASAVRGLSPSNVTITDQYSRLLNSGTRDSLSSKTSREFALIKKKESEYNSKLQAILTPILGSENFTTQVDVSMDFSVFEKTSKFFNPENQSIRSEMMIKNENSGVSGGIPGALSNQPPLKSSAPQLVNNGFNEKKVTTPINNHIESTKNYEVDTTLSHTKEQIGVIKRITVSIAINFKKTLKEYLEDPDPDADADADADPDADAAKAKEVKSSESKNILSSSSITNKLGLGSKEDKEYVFIPRTKEEIEKISSIVRAAIGISEERGDLISIDNFRFASLDAEDLEEPSIWKDKEFLYNFFRLLFTVLVSLLFILFAIKPLVYKLLNLNENDDEALQVSEAEEQFAIQDALVSDGDEYSISDSGEITIPEIKSDRDLIGLIRKIVVDEPDLATQVVKSWIKE